MEKIQQLSVLAMLGGYGLADVKSRNLPTFWMKVFLLEGLLGSIWWKGIGLDLFLALLPGLLVFFLSKITRGSIGEGDAILIFLTGWFLSAGKVWQMLCYGVFFSALCALFLFFIAKKGRHYEMPFVPFLLAGYVCCLYCWL